MPRKASSESQRARQVVAQEAARIIIDHGVRDYRLAKQKAAERLGVMTRGSLPGNAEIEAAVAEHLELFGGDEHKDYLRMMRTAALSAMQMLETYSPRLVGPVLAGTADENSQVNLHVFTDSPEAVAIELDNLGVPCRGYERRLKSRHGQTELFPGFEFHHNHQPVAATVFPFDGIRQAPLSPIDGKPMRRVDAQGVQKMLEQL